ncbi:unnamed protein product [Staurois parvus]|uniref:Secreted protein n=1 Tax=Staurois parvus TaxID=386267 RepID=A0ABN9AD52_9NEOB|nr:unnamed protein product [Staurois parvus]
MTLGRKGLTFWAIKGLTICSVCFTMCAVCCFTKETCCFVSLCCTEKYKAACLGLSPVSLTQRSSSASQEMPAGTM